MIEIENLKKIYAGRTVLDIESLKFEEGGRYALIGANGSGKSTLLKILAGIIPPDEGKVNIPKNLKLGYAPQKAFAFSMSIKKNVALACPKEQKNKIADIISKMGLTHLAKKRADKLSGGETQRLALARLLVADRNFILLDEPTASMDINYSLATEEFLNDYINEHAATLIIATHSIVQAARLGKEIIFLHEGKVLERGADILDNPQNEETIKFLEYYGKK
ncbi:MAG: ABC transporter ATP-binding protein [Christensenellales bacterium]|jgi:tungstate transport system ATP-binding protein